MRSRPATSRSMSGPAEAEVPEQRVLEDFFPGTDAGHRRVDQHEAGYALGLLRGQGEADHVADVVRDQIVAVDLQRGQHGGDVARPRFLS
jgi:hypothetical protein